ncbi:lipopolysaccharide biosynthesis protein [Salinispora arenicola]|uniref:lipopolysaccharide biosynthesis protein n=1 Tax=Salinispora arenicola TaxID=168697 RepID=UPI00207A8A8C|nr:polysaccharide biosynthesis protein [Salinispora arenicola]MCN0154468.1 polysaccharide biosynthesis protein [Salinispora arenicola]
MRAGLRPIGNHVSRRTDDGDGSRTRAAGTGARALGTAGLAVTAAGLLANGLAYLAPVLAARQLGSADLSALATTLGLIAIASVPGFGLQLAVAVHHAKHGHTDTHRATLLTAALCGSALIVATPLLIATLRLPAEALLLSAVTTAAIVVCCRTLGELQGGQRFVRLAIAMGLLAAGRYGGVLVGLLLGAGLTGSLLLGAVTAALTPIGLAALTRTADPATTSAAPPLEAGRIVTGCAAMLAMLVVSYVDLFLARQLLSANDSGAYAVGTVLTKGALWAPQVATVLALPRLAQEDRFSRTVALAVTVGCGALLILGSTLAGDLAFRLAGGPHYTHLGTFAPLFAAVGALYAVVFVLLNGAVATGVRWPAAPLWIGSVLLAAVTLSTTPRTIAGLLWPTLGAAMVTTLAMAVRTWASTPARSGRSDPAPRTAPDRG